MSKSKQQECSFAKTAMRKSVRDIIKSGKNPLTNKKLKKGETDHLKLLLKEIK